MAAEVHTTDVVQQNQQQWEAWKETRRKRLKSPDGWFSLCGLFWLKDGENSFGSDPSNEVVLPEHAIKVGTSIENNFTSILDIKQSSKEISLICQLILLFLRLVWRICEIRYRPRKGHPYSSLWFTIRVETESTPTQWFLFGSTTRWWWSPRGKESTLIEPTTPFIPPSYDFISGGIIIISRIIY